MLFIHILHPSRGVAIEFLLKSFDPLIERNSARPVRLGAFSRPSSGCRVSSVLKRELAIETNRCEDQARSIALTKWLR